MLRHLKLMGKRFEVGAWVLCEGKVYQVEHYSSQPNPLIVFLRSTTRELRIHKEDACEPLPPEFVKLLEH